MLQPLVPVTCSIERPLFSDLGDLVMTFRWVTPDGVSHHHVEYLPPTADDDEIRACMQVVADAIDSPFPLDGAGRG